MTGNELEDQMKDYENLEDKIERQNGSSVQERRKHKTISPKGNGCQKRKKTTSQCAVTAPSAAKLVLGRYLDLGPSLGLLRGLREIKERNPDFT